jgi:hypothetical protein
MKTVEFARKHNRPCLHLHSSQRDAADRFESFLQDNGMQILNVAGPGLAKSQALLNLSSRRLIVFFALSNLRWSTQKRFLWKVKPLLPDPRLKCLHVKPFHG